VPLDDELTMLREESEALADFLRMLQREYDHLRADFTAILQAAGGSIEIPTPATQAPPAATIERHDNLAQGTVTFRLMHNEK